MLEARKAAGLCRELDRKPNPELMVEREARDHSKSESELHKNDSKQLQHTLSDALSTSAYCFGACQGNWTYMA